MANPSFGGDFEALARQFWDGWGETMRRAAAPVPSAPSGWDEAMALWSRLAQGGGGEADDAVQRFDAQARGWFGQMQQLAARFAGTDAGASDIAAAWKQMLGGTGGNPFADLFRGVSGRGQQGPEQWVEQAAPYIQALQQQGRQWLGTPAFGVSREHQQRWQKLAQAQLDYQQRQQAYAGLMGVAGQAAFALFERKLADRGAAGRQLESARALFDLWIDAAEEAYADVALSPEFRAAYGEMINAQMRLRGAVQGEVEQACELLGMPSRTEVDSAHRKIVQLERELRRLRDRVEAGGQTAIAGTDAAGAKTPGRGPDLGPSPRPSPAGRGGKGAARKKASSKPASSKKASSKKASSRNASSKPAKAASAKTTDATPAARKNPATTRAVKKATQGKR